MLFRLALPDFKTFAVHAFTGLFPDWPGFLRYAKLTPTTGLRAISIMYQVALYSILPLIF